MDKLLELLANIKINQTDDGGTQNKVIKELYKLYINGTIRRANELLNKSS